jgi:alkanesulfonate monooxygenase SsuD/methylene tetrahydromethanopterin reductase-like flavin-dependent oxidoreductase (luciferase family)
MYNKSMNFYFFDQLCNAPKSLISKELEDAGFYGMLVPYGVGFENQFIETARALDPEQNLKYIIGVRPHTVSPQYLAMMIKSINDIDPDRVWINFVAGFIRDFELDLGGSMFPEDFEKSFKVRKAYMAKYIPVFNDFCKKKNIQTKLCLTGMSEEVFSLVEDHADYNIVAYEPYNRFNGFREIIKPRIMSICPVIEDDEEYLLYLKSLDNIPQDIMFTTTEDLMSKINDLRDAGIDSIMLFTHGNSDSDHDHEKYKIIEFVKKYKKIYG